MALFFLWLTFSVDCANCLLLITANLVRLGSVESVISVNRSSEHPECKHLNFFCLCFVLHV